MSNTRVLISQDKDITRWPFKNGLAKALSFSGNECRIWDQKNKSAFDVFDTYNVDLFICQLENITESIIRCLEEKPNVKLCLEINKEINKENILKIDELLNRTGKPNFIYSNKRGLKEKVEKLDIDFEIIDDAADLFDFSKGKEKEEYKSDICYIGLYDKNKNINETLGYLCKDFTYNIKIFGHMKWPYNQYCGHIDDRTYRDISKSSKICLNLKRDNYIHNMVFNYLSNKCFVLSEECDLVNSLFSGCLESFNNQESMITLIEHYLKNQDLTKVMVDKGYNTIIDKHTYFDRAIFIFDKLNFDTESLKNSKNNILKEINN